MPLADLPNPIKEHILKSCNGEDYHNKPNTYSLTELLYCVRKAYYRRIKPKPTELEAAFNMYRGKVFDNLWSPLFQHNQVRSTYRCRNIPITISGKYDFLTTDNPPILTDLKTTKSLYYVTEPSEEYKTQVRFYAWLNSIEKAQIVYIDFGDCKIFPVEVGDCSKILEELENKAEQLYNAIKTKTTPHKSLLSPEWMCKKCDYLNECHGES
jgi:CRISPR-associated exonuclease Cas4